MKWKIKDTNIPTELIKSEKKQILKGFNLENSKL
jgi:hypothetical protein